MTALKPEISVITDQVSPQYKATALKLAQEMPLNGTLKEKSKFIFDQLVKEHPNFEWGVLISKREAE
jgi:hypothetical protein